MKEIQGKVNNLTTLVEVLSNAAVAADEAREANKRNSESTQVFTPQMLDGLNDFIYRTSWAVRDEVRQLKELLEAGKASA